MQSLALFSGFTSGNALLKETAQMVGTYDKPDAAFAALQEECKKPTSGTWRSTRETAATVGKIAAGTAISAATGFAPAVSLPFVLPVLPPLVSTIAGVASSAVTSSAQALLQHEDDPDLLKRGLGIGGEAIALDRKDIYSILQGVSLQSVAGKRAGTEGKVRVKELLPLMMSHYQKAQQLWNAEPFAAGKTHSELVSCHDAELLYRKFVEVDYHFSKMKAYADALKEVAEAYATYCERNATTLRTQFATAQTKIKEVMNKDEAWHEHHCAVASHCYRTHKLSRVFK